MTHLKNTVFLGIGTKRYTENWYLWGVAKRELTITLKEHGLRCLNKKILQVM